MKSLNIVQTIVKVFKILSIIAIVGVSIGIGGCILGCISLLIAPTVADVGENLARPALELFAEAIVLAGELIVAVFIFKYLKKEFEDGTPFTHSGANELLQVGIISVVAPIVAIVIASVVTGVSSALLPDAVLNTQALPFLESLEDISFEYSNEADLTGGIAMILISFLLRYGADVIEEKKQ